MTGGELAIIMRALGSLESKVDFLTDEQHDLRGDVDALNEAATVAATLATSRRGLYARIVVAIGCICSLTTAGTALVVWAVSTTHPGS